MAAVLLDAIRTLRNARELTDVRQRRRRREALDRLAADDAVWPFSFLRICAALDLDAAAIRQAALSHDGAAWLVCA
jgi:hypothetical protein